MSQTGSGESVIARGLGSSWLCRGTPREPFAAAAAAAAAQKIATTDAQLCAKITRVRSKIAALAGGLFVTAAPWLFNPRARGRDCASLPCAVLRDCSASN